MTQKRIAAPKTKPRPPKHKRVEIYRGRNREWRFRIRGKNGKIIAVSSEGYTRERGVKRALQIVGESLDWGQR